MAKVTSFNNVNNGSIGTSFGLHLTKKNIEVAFFGLTCVGGAGVILNILGIIVFNRKRFEKCSMGLYNSLLAVINNGVILVTSWNYVPFYFNFNPLVASLASCILTNYLQHAFTVFSSWLDMMITVDRMICITYPKRFESFKKKKTICLMVAVSFVVCMVSHVLMFEYRIVTNTANLTLVGNLTNNTNNITVAHVTHTCITSNNNLLAINVITIALRIILPFTVMTVSNIILIRNLKKIKGERYSQREASFTHSVVALNVLFFVTHLPFAVLLIYQTVLKFIEREKFAKLHPKLTYAYEISLIISSYNYTLPTVINLIFNRLFREEFIDMLVSLRNIFWKPVDKKIDKNMSNVHSS